MKLPRWLVIGMLTSSVLAVLAAAGWWWVTWPERTAREFVERLTTVGDEASWKEMLIPEVVGESVFGWFPDSVKFSSSVHFFLSPLSLYTVYQVFLIKSIPYLIYFSPS